MAKKKGKRKPVAAPDSLRLKDAKGKDKIRLFVDGESGLPGVQFLDDAGIPRLELGLQRDFRPYMSLSGNSSQAFGIGVGEDGDAGMTFFRGNGKPFLSVCLDPDGDVCIFLFDKAGEASRPVMSSKVQ